MIQILVLCTGNSARSLMGEALLAHLGAGRLIAHSAGSRPTGQPHPQALAQLRRAGLSADGLRSKSWDEFAAPGAPPIDIVLTVCDSAAAEPCPYWPGAPVTAHWGLDDPAAATGSDDEIESAFATAFAILDHRVRRLLALPFEEMSAPDLRRALTGIGASMPTIT